MLLDKKVNENTSPEVINLSYTIRSQLFTIDPDQLYNLLYLPFLPHITLPQCFAAPSTTTKAPRATTPSITVTTRPTVSALTYVAEGLSSITT